MAPKVPVSQMRKQEIKGEWAMKRNMTGLYPWKKDRNCPLDNILILKDPSTTTADHFKAKWRCHFIKRPLTARKVSKGFQDP